MKKINLEEYLRGQIARAPLLLRSYTHDKSGQKYLPRGLFRLLNNYIQDFLSGQKEIRMIGIPGLRGVGKTTLLAQVYLKLFSQYQERMLFLSVDRLVNDLGSSLYEALEEYQKMRQMSFEELRQETFIFLDEIHFDQKWASTLKSIYDRTKYVFVVFSGSSALSLQATADLARRVILERLYPMDFSEYILLKTKYRSLEKPVIKVTLPVKNLKKEIKEALFYSKNARECLEKLRKLSPKANRYWLNIDPLELNRYLSYGTMPYALTIDEEARVQLLTDQLIDRIIEKDLTELKLFRQETLEKIRPILLMAAASSEISATSMAKNLNQITPHKIIQVFSVLTKAEFLIKARPYGSVYKGVRKPAKYYFMSPALRHTLLLEVKGESAFRENKGSYLEDIVALTLYREFGRVLTSPIFYDSARGGADFILKLSDKKIVIEVGYGDKGVGQAQATLEKIKGQYGLVVSNSQLAIEDNAVKVPLEFFLLM